MPITELALLRLTPSTSITSPTLLTNLSTALHAMANFTSPSPALSLPQEPQESHGFHYYHSLSDPTLIYLIGSWSSLSQHLETWIPSRENQALLELLKGQVEVEWMFHVDVDPTTVPVERKVVLGIERFFVGRGGKAASEGVFEEFKRRLEQGGHMASGGWSIEEGGGEKEEFVLFTGWESVEKYKESERTGPLKEQARIGDFVERSERDYAVKLKVD